MIETIASHLDTIAALAPTWGLLFGFVFMAIESSFIPFPSEVVMIPAGFLAARGEFGFGNGYVAASAAVAVGIAGSVAGAYINYALALYLGRPFLERHGKWFFISPETLDRSCEIFNRYGAATTFVCRMIPAIRQLISIPAGIAKMPLAPFTLFTALGAGVWSFILTAAGFAIGRSAGNITYLELCTKGKDMTASNLPAVIGIAVALAALHIFISRRVLGKRSPSKRA
jgi:membrane protein DedA with SNARE-associated domain